MCLQQLKVDVSNSTIGTSSTSYYRCGPDSNANQTNMPIIGPDPETSSEPGPCERSSQSGPCGTSDSTAIEVPKNEFQDCESGEVVDYNGCTGQTHTKPTHAYHWSRSRNQF